MSNLSYIMEEGNGYMTEYAAACYQYFDLRQRLTARSRYHGAPWFHAGEDSGEEWDRHEALHNDVTNQERTTERLFENNMEVTWDKGSSGLVFYTDAAFWDKQEGDFDEKTADDWDLDMSVYTDANGGDRDLRDFIQMRRQQRMLQGLDCSSVFSANTKKQRRKERQRKNQRQREAKKHQAQEGLDGGSSVTGAKTKKQRRKERQEEKQRQSEAKKQQAQEGVDDGSSVAGAKTKSQRRKERQEEKQRQREVKKQQAQEGVDDGSSVAGAKTKSQRRKERQEEKQRQREVKKQQAQEGVDDGSSVAGAKTKSQRRKERQEEKQRQREVKKQALEEDPLGDFEKHTKGFGRKIMEAQGWIEGEGLGKTVKGIARALHNDGHDTYDKRGFGYLGKKLSQKQRQKRQHKQQRQHSAEKQVIISTIYDDPKVNDPDEPLFRSLGPYHLKYRDEVLFTKGSGTAHSYS